MSITRVMSAVIEPPRNDIVRGTNQTHTTTSMPNSFVIVTESDGA
jgi:hypothetical protein